MPVPSLCCITQRYRDQFGGPLVDSPSEWLNFGLKEMFLSAISGGEKSSNDREL